ncbi:MAG: ATP-binding cassette domain-containing protein, partial [Pseudomonadota bacterium]
MLEIKDLSVQYGRLVALRGISLSINEGEVACIVGPNGAGKSTTLLTISGVLNPAKGDILYEGKSIRSKSPEAVAGLGITQVPEGRHIFTSLSVEENLQIGGTLRQDRSSIKA